MPREKGHILTPRKIEVMNLFAQALPCKVVAFKLGVECTTIKVHLRNLMTIYGANTTAELLIKSGALVYNPNWSGEKEAS